MKGSALIPVLLLLVVLVVGVVVFFLKFNQPSDKDNPADQNNIQRNPYLGTPCISNPQIIFTSDLTEADKIRSVQPTLVTAGNSRHRVFLDIDTSKTDKVAIYAPVDSEVVNGTYKNAKGALDYDLRLQVSCEIWYVINHITEPVEKIKKAFPATPQTDTRTGEPFKKTVQVKAGELLGYTAGTPTAHNFDFAVFDLNHVNEGLPADNGSNYGLEKNFICPLDILSEDIKKSYYSKINPQEKPYSNCKAY